ncbi:MAG TPA: type II CAAX endopeptidase family protein [Ktedonobacteraceae bacterium]|nr:type II CAAX endopeptidase family protein [Ktedonobacteraceae bacterium]
MDEKPHNPYAPAASDAPPLTEYSAQEQALPRKLWSWGDVLLISLVGIVVSIIGTACLGIILSLADFNNVDAIVASMPYLIGSLAVEFFAIVGSVYFLGIQRKHLSWYAIGFRPMTKLWILGSLGIGVLAYLVTLLLNYITGSLLHIPQNALLDTIGTNDVTWMAIIVVTVLSGIAIPFASESLFRGVIYNFLRERWGIWIGAIICSLIEAITSFDISIGIVTFFVALLAIFAYERSKSLWAAVLVQGVVSVLGLIASFLLTSPGAKIPLF